MSATVPSIPYVRLAALYGAYFAYIGAYGPYLSLYLQSAGQSAARIGAIIALTQCMRIFAPNAWAWIADRTGATIVNLRIALVLSAVVFTGLFVADGFVAIALVLALHAFCSGGINPLVESITLASLRDRIGRYGVIRLWGSVGFIVAVLGVGYQLDRAPPASLLITISGLLVATLIIGFTLPGSAAPAREAGERLMPVARRPEVAAMLAATFLMSVAHGPLYAFLSIHLAEHDYSKTTIGVLWSVGVLAEIAVFWLMPRWLQGGAVGVVFIASFAFAIARFLLIGWAVDSVVLVTIAQALHGATFGSYHACALALLNRWFTGGRRVRGQALYSSVSFGAGGMLGAAASGLAWERLGPPITFTLAAAAAGIGMMILVAHRKAL